MAFPIFVYHDVLDDPVSWGQVPPGHRPYVLSRTLLLAHLEVLTQPGFYCQRLDSLALPGWDNGGMRFVLTFDDGHLSNYEQVLPLLLESDLTACFFIIAGSIGKCGQMGWREIRELASAGMEIGSHSLTHPFMDQLPVDRVREEYLRSKDILEQGLGLPVTAASLPRGWLGPRVREIVAELGYKVFCTSRFGLVDDLSDPLLLPRFAVKAGMSDSLLVAMVTGKRWPVLSMGAREWGKRAVKRAVGIQRWQTLRKAALAVADLGRGAA